MKISKQELEALQSDIETVAEFHGVNVGTADGGQTGLKTMWALFDVVCRNRSYDDAHPAFASGHWKRILPFTGRPYCWLYDQGLNDTHIATALRAIKSGMLNAEVKL